VEIILDVPAERGQTGLDSKQSADRRQPGDPVLFCKRSEPLLMIPPSDVTSNSPQSSLKSPSEFACLLSYSSGFAPTKVPVDWLSELPTAATSFSCIPRGQTDVKLRATGTL